MQTPKAAAILTIVAMYIDNRLGPSTEPCGTSTDEDEDATVELDVAALNAEIRFQPEQDTAADTEHVARSGQQSTMIDDIEGSRNV